MFSTDQLDALSEFVSKFGGALALVAGRRFNPNAYRQTVIEKMLPVELETYALTTSAEAGGDKPIHLELTPAGKASTMLQVAETPAETLARWNSLPPIFWDARVAGPKPAAEVLLVDPDPAKESRLGKMPVLALQQYGAGRVLYFGTDNTWRWRKNVGETFFTALWGQITQRMALTHLLGGAKRTQLSTDRQQYAAGDRVTVFARLYTAGFEPVTEAWVRGFYTPRTGAGGTPTEVRLRALPEQPGMYRGEFVAPGPGRYAFEVEPDPVTKLEFDVFEPQFELGDTAMNELLLHELAELSGGAYFQVTDLGRLPEAISRDVARVRSTVEVDVWSSPLYFLAMLVLLTTEWLVRKASQLK